MVKRACRPWKRYLGDIGYLAVGARNHDVFGLGGESIRIAKKKRNRDCDQHYDRTKNLEPEENEDGSGYQQSERNHRAFSGDSNRARDTANHRPGPRPSAVSIA